MAPRRLLDYAFCLLVPAPLVFALPALLGLLGVASGPVTAGATAAAVLFAVLGLGLVLYGTWRTPHRAPALVAVVVALGGPLIVARFYPDAGVALGWLGLGMVAWIRDPRGLWVGALAAVGAFLRGIGPVGWLLLCIAGPWLAWEMSIAARDLGQHLPPDAVPA